MKKFVLFQMIAFLFLVNVDVFGDSADDYWPTWRGPNRSGVSPKGNPPLTWSETENIKWKVKLEGDASNSSPVIWGDKIFFQTAVDTKIKDDTPAPGPGGGGGGGHPGGGAPGARPGGGERGGPGGHPGGGSRGGRPGGGGGFGMSKPTTQFKFNLLCLDRKTGNLLWKRPFAR